MNAIRNRYRALKILRNTKARIKTIQEFFLKLDTCYIWETSTTTGEVQNFCQMYGETPEINVALREESS